jgi:hypothetical protein
MVLLGHTKLGHPSHASSIAHHIKNKDGESVPINHWEYGLFGCLALSIWNHSRYVGDPNSDILGPEACGKSDRLIAEFTLTLNTK